MMSYILNAMLIARFLMCCWVTYVYKMWCDVMLRDIHANIMFCYMMLTYEKCCFMMWCWEICMLNVMFYDVTLRDVHIKCYVFWCDAKRHTYINIIFYDVMHKDMHTKCHVLWWLLRNMHVKCHVLWWLLRNMHAKCHVLWCDAKKYAC